MAESKREYWARQVLEQEVNGQTVREFCRERVMSEHSFYAWRRRLKGTAPVQFALIEPKPATAKPTSHWCELELELASGERLRIGKGVDPSALRVVLEALRA